MRKMCMKDRPLYSFYEVEQLGADEFDGRSAYLHPEIGSQNQNQLSENLDPGFYAYGPVDHSQLKIGHHEQKCKKHGKKQPDYKRRAHVHSQPIHSGVYE